MNWFKNIWGLKNKEEIVKPIEKTILLIKGKCQQDIYEEGNLFHKKCYKQVLKGL